MLLEDNGKLYRRYDKELLCIEPYNLNSFRIRATHLSKFQDDSFSALEKKSDNCKAQIKINGNSATIINGKIRCEVLLTGKLKFFNDKNELVLEEYYKNRFMPNAEGETDSALEIIPRTFIAHRTTSNFNLSVKFEAKEDERFYGMGQYSLPYLNLKGSVLELAQRNSQISIPFVISNKGYGLFWNNPAQGKVYFGRNITDWTSDSTKEMDYWITVGDNTAEIVESYTKVTGYVPMIPEFATGFWQSKLRYRSQEELLNVAKEYKKRGLPISVIVIDFFHWTAQGEWKFDNELWPDPENMVKTLKEMGIEVMVSIWPTVEEKSENFKYMEEMGYLIRSEAGPRLGIKNKETYFDATNPDACSFVWNKIKNNYYDKGIRFFWLDECEPEITKYEYENFRFYQGSVKEIGNIYPKEIAKMVYEGLKNTGQNEIISLIRCAWAGSQKYGALVWTGDISSDFAALRTQVTAGMNMGLVGISWWTTDIGGFHGGNGESETFRECFIRWFQFGAFSPIFRLHGFREPMVVAEGGVAFTGGNAEGWKYSSGSPNEVWSFGENVYNICRKYLFLREQIRPYIMEQMKIAHKKGTPVMRPLFYDYPEDEKSWDVEDQYLFGPYILVAPIVYEGQRTRKLYLPSGNWMNLYTKKVYKGNSYIECEAPLEEIPVFVKEDKYKSIFGDFNFYNI